MLTETFIDQCRDWYLPDPADRADPRCSVLRAEIPAGVAPAYVATAGFDPLRDEGEAYADLLEKARRRVTRKRFPALIHGFFNLVGVGRSGPAANREIAAELRAGLLLISACGTPRYCTSLRVDREPQALVERQRGFVVALDVQHDLGEPGAARCSRPRTVSSRPRPRPAAEGSTPTT